MSLLPAVGKKLNLLPTRSQLIEHLILRGASEYEEEVPGELEGNPGVLSQRQQDHQDHLASAIKHFQKKS